MEEDKFEMNTQLTVRIFGSYGISRFARERDAFLIDGAHFELVEMARSESLHGAIQVVGVGLQQEMTDLICMRGFMSR